MEFKEITPQDATSFLLPRHYSGRRPSISKAFGWFCNNELKAVVTFGKPASNSLCIGVCGEEYASQVYELNRLCRTDDLNEPLSEFVGAALRALKALNWIIVSYSDTAMNHHGYIYQACNFLYTGKTKQRTDLYTPNGKHSRHYGKDAKDSGIRKVRSSKHRYVFICANDKREKKRMLKALRYDILPYPKGDNSNYVLGDYLKDTFVISKKEN